MSDPNIYRSYECNIQCPKLKATKEFRCATCKLGNATADSLTVSGQTISGSTSTPYGIMTYSGSSPFSTIHTITPALLPVLGNKQCNGELSFYLNNNTYVNVSMGVVVKSVDTIQLVLIYQRVGNFPSVTLEYSGNNLILTTSPASTCKWSYRGI